MLLQNQEIDGDSVLPLDGGETVYVLGNVDAAEVAASGYEVIDGNDPAEQRTAAEADVALISMTARNVNTGAYVSNDPATGLNPENINPSVIEGFEGLDGKSPFGAADACVVNGGGACTDNGLRFGGSFPWESNTLDFTGMKDAESWEVTPSLDAVQQVMTEVGAENTVLDIYFRQPFVLDEASGLRDAGAIVAWAARQPWSNGSVGMIGSANLDIRSFSINYELNAIIYDARLTQELVAAFERDLGGCRPFDVEEYERRSAPSRFRDSAARLLSPLL